MYIPKQFEETDKNRIIALASEYSFATLVTTNEGVPFASHLPLLIEEHENLLILGHMARANEQCHHFNNNDEVLVIFQGPHAYISPSNYEGAGVPTWNYASVHMYGIAKLFESEDKLKYIIESLTEKHEKAQISPWIPEYPIKMLDAIVGFEIQVNRVEAKYKLSQNRPEIDRQNIVMSLSGSGSESAKGVATLMKENGI